MKLNFDAMRDLLFVIEEQPRNIDINQVVLSNTLSRYDKNDLGYALEKLIESGLLIGKARPTKDGIYFFIDSISYEGHQFLDHVRSDTIWEKIKDTAKKLGVKGIGGIATIATKVFIDYLSGNLNP